ncbi:MAG: transposase [Chloroflexi bacterium]|nr:transposase [Chloroflexota bacterium]MBI3168547.1 transposase [Chloroflexota bacterium]
MPVHPNFDPDFLYFITTTAEQHHYIFKRESIIRIILDSLHFLRTSKRMELFCFVIMPNHVHLICKFSREHPMSDFMRDFKRHTARQIIRQLMAEEKTGQLDVLQKLNKHDDQQYKIWEDSYDARDVFTADFLWQKMEYIHYNPCRPKWNLANTPEEYPWSSARFYMLDKPSVIPVDDVRNLFV